MVVKTQQRVPVQALKKSMMVFMRLRLIMVSAMLEIEVAESLSKELGVKAHKVMDVISLEWASD